MLASLCCQVRLPFVRSAACRTETSLEAERQHGSTGHETGCLRHAVQGPMPANEHRQDGCHRTSGGPRISLSPTNGCFYVPSRRSGGRGEAPSGPLQCLGGTLNLNVHFRAQCRDGVFATNETGGFHPVRRRPRPHVGMVVALIAGRGVWAPGGARSGLRLSPRRAQHDDVGVPFANGGEDGLPVGRPRHAARDEDRPLAEIGDLPPFAGGS
jgi:hypothetical protein